MKKFALVLISSVLLAGCFSYVRAAGRRPNLAPQAQATPAPDPIFQCQYCKRAYKSSEGKMMRFHVHDQDHWFCIDCFYDAIDAGQKYKIKLDEEELAAKKK